MVPAAGGCYNPSMALIIDGASVVVAADGIHTDRTIRIDNGIITDIEPKGSGTPDTGAAAAEDRIVDGRGRAVLAGWKNAHTHAAMTLLRGYGDDMELHTWLQERIWPLEARLAPEHLYWGTRLAAIEMLKSGTTFANDMYFNTPEVWRAFQDAGIRAAVGLAMFDFGDPEERRRTMAAVDRLLERYADGGPAGAAGSRVFLAVAPHSIYTAGGELLQWAARRAAETGLPFHIHMSETRKEVEDCLDAHGMRPFQWLDHLGVLQALPGRIIAAHGVWLDEAERRLAAEAGVTIVHNPASNMKLASGVLDWRALREAGVPLMLAPDGVASNNNLDMFDEMKLAALLQKVHTGDPTVLTAQEVVGLAAGAYSTVFQRHGVGGHLAVGAPADLQLINLDHPQMVPLHHLESNLAYAANGSMVETVIVGGEVVMHDRRVADEAEVIRQARRCAAELVSSA